MIQKESEESDYEGQIMKVQLLTSKNLVTVNTRYKYVLKFLVLVTVILCQLEVSKGCNSHNKAYTPCTFNEVRVLAKIIYTCS